jgi:class 3 adenylate cyclase/tetratricopeptide (TPR) repeat protein
MAACRQCGSELPEGARFCPACGTAVDGRRGEERKVVTVLFADLVDSTASADARDPEEVRAALRPQLAHMRTELERFGGTFEKYVGDAVMAVFGAPVAHEDDPERAVRAALAIRDGLSGVRVAVNTGEAVVSLGASSGTPEGIATGDVVNTTFRIEEAAEVGTVLVGEATYRATQGAIEYGERRLLQAKGKADPLAVYEALRAGLELRAAAEAPSLAPLVGRREELSLVLDTIARARRDRTVQLVTLVGVPGIGKSRLVWELQRALAGEPGLVTWRRGRCLPYGDGVSYWALGEMVKAQAGILESDTADTVHTKLGKAVRELVTDATEADWVESHLRPLVALEAPASERREEAFTAWRRFFEALGELGPLVLVFEDLHWADVGLLDFLDHLADWATLMPLVLLCTARPELLERRVGWGSRANAATIALSPLSETETSTLVSHLLRRRVSADLADAVVGQAGGNPLYAEEFVRMLVDRGLLYRDGDEWRFSPGEVPLPESVQGIVAARLDTLEPDQKTVLRDASVIGRGFWPAAVASVSELERSTIDEILRMLERKEFIRRVGASSVATELQYSFHHAVVRDVAYNSIPRAERAQKHWLAATWIESLGRPEDHAETIAHHYRCALEFARSARQPTDELAAKARGAFRAAGERALALNAPEGAASYYEAALELTSGGQPEHADLLFLRAKALYRAGRPDDRLLEEARRALVEQGQLERAAECGAILGDVHWRQGDRDAAFEQLQQTIDALSQPSYAKAYALATLSRIRNAADEPQAAIALGVEALEIAEALGLTELRVAILTTIGIARTLTGDPSGLEDLRQSVAAAEQVSSLETVRGYYNLGGMLGTHGDLASSFATYAKGRLLVERVGDAAWIAWYRAELLMELYWRGRWNEALTLASELTGASAAESPASVEFDASLVRARIELARGDHAEASDNVRHALAFARGAPDPQNLYPALAFAARAAIALGADDEARAHVDELLERAAVRPSPPSYWVVDLALAAWAIGRGTDVLDVVRDSAWRTRWLEAADAIVREDFVAAAAVCGEIGALPEEADIRLAAAARDRAAGRGPDEDGAVRALAFYRGVGATAYAQAAELLVGHS